jgi:hypothetical protein
LSKYDTTTMLEPLPELVLDKAKSEQPPPKVQQALSSFPKGEPVSLDEFLRQSRNLPYGRWITDDGTQVLYNGKYELLVWPADAERPEHRDDFHWAAHCGAGRLKDGRFYSDGSVYDLGTSELHHALEALLDAWQRGDRATADVLAAWLLGRHRAYRQLIRAYEKELAQRRKG